MAWLSDDSDSQSQERYLHRGTTSNGQQETSADVWWYDGQRVTFRSLNSNEILRTLQIRPNVTMEALSEALNINIAAVKKQLASMSKKGYIQRTDTGEWHVLAINAL